MYSILSVNATSSGINIYIVTYLLTQLFILFLLRTGCPLATPLTIQYSLLKDQQTECVYLLNKLIIYPLLLRTGCPPATLLTIHYWRLCGLYVFTIKYLSDKLKQFILLLFRTGCPLATPLTIQYSL